MTKVERYGHELDAYILNDQDNCGKNYENCIKTKLVAIKIPIIRRSLYNPKDLCLTTLQNGITVTFIEANNQLIDFNYITREQTYADTDDAIGGLPIFNSCATTLLGGKRKNKTRKPKRKRGKKSSRRSRKH